MKSGVVAEFDEVVGIGKVTDGGGASYPFHCTQIADGSRTIAPGTEVWFEVIAGHLGQWEAARLTPR